MGGQVGQVDGWGFEPCSIPYLLPHAMGVRFEACRALRPVQQNDVCPGVFQHVPSTQHMEVLMCMGQTVTEVCCIAHRWCGCRRNQMIFGPPACRRKCSFCHDFSPCKQTSSAWANLLAVLVHQARAELHGAQHNRLRDKVIKGRSNEQELTLTGHCHPAACNNRDMLVGVACGWGVGGRWRCGAGDNGVGSSMMGKREGVWCK